MKRKNLDHFKIGKYTFDIIARELKIGENSTKLSAIEANLLQMFSENLNGIVRRDFALNRIWQDEDYLKGRSLNVYVSKLRSLLKEDKNIEILNGTWRRLSNGCERLNNIWAFLTVIKIRYIYML